MLGTESGELKLFNLQTAEVNSFGSLNIIPHKYCLFRSKLVMNIVYSVNFLKRPILSLVILFVGIRVVQLSQHGSNSCGTFKGKLLANMIKAFPRFFLNLELQAKQPK